MAADLARNCVGGMGAVPNATGVSFRVWAPHAHAVFVAGSFNGWSTNAHPMAREDNGYWFANISAAKIGSEYRYLIRNGEKQIWRIDPYARQVTSSVGNSIVVDPAFDWSGDDFQMPAINEMIIYELHLGTFHDQEQGTRDKFEQAASKLEHLQRLGVNVIEVMPLAQFAGHSSWGHNPSCIFAVETNYGGPLGFKRFVNRYNGDPFQRVAYSRSRDDHDPTPVARQIGGNCFGHPPH